jgi:Tol biopolymer transport system component
MTDGIIQPVISQADISHGYTGKLAFKTGSGVCILDLSTGQQRTFGGLPSMRKPDWHPEGKLIVCGKNNVYLVNTETGEFHIVLSEIVGKTGGTSSWSSDGKKLVYRRSMVGDGLYILSVDTYTSMKIPNIPDASEPDWSPIGDRIAFTSMMGQRIQPQIYVLYINSVQSKTCQPAQLTEGKALNRYPAWSPDGRQLAFGSFRDDFSAIYVMNADGTHQRRLTNHETGDFDPAWSPDGQYIVFSRRFYRVGGKLIKYAIHLMRPDGSEITSLGVDGIEPDWWMESGPIKK